MKQIMGVKWLSGNQNGGSTEGCRIKVSLSHQGTHLGSIQKLICGMCALQTGIIFLRKKLVHFTAGGEP